jgi:hypothetical protein
MSGSPRQAERVTQSAHTGMPRFCERSLRAPHQQAKTPTSEPCSNRASVLHPAVVKQPVGADALLTFPPSKAYQPDRWTLVLPSCAYRQTRERASRRHYRVSIRPSLGTTTRAAPAPLRFATFRFPHPRTCPASRADPPDFPHASARSSAGLDVTVCEFVLHGRSHTHSLTLHDATGVGVEP